MTIPASGEWIVEALHGTNIDPTTGRGRWCQLGIDGTPLATAQTFANRNYYWQDGLGTRAKNGSFSPDGKDATGAVVDNVLTGPGGTWDTDVIQPLAAGGIDIVPNVFGIRGTPPDATWPGASQGGTNSVMGPRGHRIIDAWVPGDGGFVDRAVTGWANLFALAPRLMIVRLWHEHGNGIYTDASDNWSYFRSNWIKVVDRWRALGVVPTLAEEAGLTSATTGKVLIAWCPASHPANSHSDGPDAGNNNSFPGSDYVHFIGRDVYVNNVSGVDPGHPNGLTLADSGKPWYDEFKPGGSSGANPTTAFHPPRPLAAFESGIESGAPTGDPKRPVILQELTDRLTGVHADPWDGIAAWLWWGGGGGAVGTDNALTDIPAGFQALWQSVWGQDYFLKAAAGVVPSASSGAGGMVGWGIKI